MRGGMVIGGMMILGVKIGCGERGGEDRVW